MIDVNEIGTSYKKYLPYELKENFIPAYINKYTGQANVMTEGTALFFKAGTNEPKTISIYVYHKELDEVIREETVESLQFRAGKFLLMDSIGGGMCYADGLACYPNEDFVVMACFTPFASDGTNVELYDVYFFVQGCNGCILEQIYGKNNTSLQKWAVAYWKNVPQNVVFTDRKHGNSIITNVVSGGSFNDTNLELFATNDGDYSYVDGQVRDFVTYLNRKKNLYYIWYSFNTLVGYRDIKDNLSVQQFSVFDDEYIDIESSPKDYLLINGTFITSTVAPSYKALGIKLDGAFALRQERKVMLSFVAKNFDPNLGEVVMTFNWREMVEGSEIESGTYEIPVITLTNTWTKYNVVLAREFAEVGEIIVGSENAYTEIQMRLPVNSNFSMGITNVFLGYDLDTEVTYPRDNVKEGNTKPIYNYITAYHNVGVIIPRLDRYDTINSIKMDGRIIYADSVHLFSYLNDDNSIKEDMPSYRYSLKPLYNYLIDMGYPAGSGEDYVQYSNLLSGVYKTDASNLGISGIFEWNTPNFNPTFSTSAKIEEVIEFVEFHRGQDVPNDLRFKAYKVEDSIGDTWYTANLDNYRDEFITNKGSVDLFEPYNRLSVLGTAPYFDFTGTVPLEIKYPTTSYNVNVTRTNAHLCFNRNLGAFGTSPLLNNILYYSKQFGFLKSQNKVSPSLSYIYNVPDKGLALKGSNNNNTYQGDGNNGISILCNNLGIITGENSSKLAQLLSIPASNVRIVQQSGSLPTKNPAYNIKPNDGLDAKVYTYKKLINNEASAVVYYKQNDAYDIYDNPSAQNLLLRTLINNCKGLTVALKSDNLIDYRNHYFYFTCSAKREYIYKIFKEGKSYYEEKSVDDSRFCFYFYTGTETKPTGVPADYRFIPINIINARNKAAISNAIELAINTYRVALPNTQNTILRGRGTGEFDIKNRTTQRIMQNDVVLCDNLRNAGILRPRSIIYNRNINAHTDGNVVNQTDYIDVETSNFYNETLVYYHISII